MNKLLTNKHILICLDVRADSKLKDEFEYIKNNFCGIVLKDAASLRRLEPDPRAVIYACGDIESLSQQFDQLPVLYIIKELSRGYEEEQKAVVISIGEVPIVVHGAGIYFRQFFPDLDWFGKVSSAHQFQSLGESNKPGIAYRKGIYLTPVAEHSEGLKFNLLRCSSNLQGPTCDFGPVDDSIIARVNAAANMFFEQPVKFNHVLAQIYFNQYDENNEGLKAKIKERKAKIKERKAKIKEHSDKTKDMPKNALIAFCTFYGNEPADKSIRVSSFDRVYKNTSVLTKLKFRLKDDVKDQLVKNFDITLYPDSVFIMSLQTNKLYTHEIVPSQLPIDILPTRMGYVIRCSNTEAIHKGGRTYVIEGGNETELKKINDGDMAFLKGLYARENATSESIEYPDTYFSMNSGDYLAPILRPG